MLAANGFKCAVRPTKVLIWNALEAYIVQEESSLKTFEESVRRAAREESRGGAERQRGADIKFMRENLTFAKKLLEEIKELPEC